MECCGIVIGKAILGASTFRDFSVSIHDIVDDHSDAYERELHKAREIVFQELDRQAEALGADTVVGIDIDYGTVGEDGSMPMMSINSTAVKTRRRNVCCICWHLRCCWWDVLVKKGLLTKIGIS